MEDMRLYSHLKHLPLRLIQQINNSNAFVSLKKILCKKTEFVIAGKQGFEALFVPDRLTPPALSFRRIF